LEKYPTPRLADFEESSVTPVPAISVRCFQNVSVRASGRYVLYWMIATRRLTSNFALDRAPEHYRAFGKPLHRAKTLREKLHPQIRTWRFGYSVMRTLLVCRSRLATVRVTIRVFGPFSQFRCSAL
jgi:hypothetical protein